MVFSHWKRSRRQNLLQNEHSAPLLDLNEVARWRYRSASRRAVIKSPLRYAGVTVTQAAGRMFMRRHASSSGGADRRLLRVITVPIIIMAAFGSGRYRNRGSLLGKYRYGANRAMSGLTGGTSLRSHSLPHPAQYG